LLAERKSSYACKMSKGLSRKTVPSPIAVALGLLLYVKGVTNSG